MPNPRSRARPHRRAIVLLLALLMTVPALPGVISRPLLDAPSAAASTPPGVPTPGQDPLPYQGALPAGVHATIYRDAQGVPDIYANDTYSLFFANGYVQAQDRLFQMDVLRHVGYGDSASVLGPGQLASDMQVRRDLYSPQQIHDQYENATPEMKAVIQAYSDGVNYAMAQMEANGTLPAAFYALGHQPKPWTPEDSVASIDYLIGYFGLGGGLELQNAQDLAQLRGSLGSLPAAYAALGDMAWVKVNDTYTTIPAQDRVVNGNESILPYGQVPPEQLALALDAPKAIPWNQPNAVSTDGPSTTVALTGSDYRLRAHLGIGPNGAGAGASGSGSTPQLDLRYGVPRGIFSQFHWGSNAVLVNGSLTRSGKPVMLGGPQMGYYEPPIPYEVGLHGAGYDVRGMGVASAPGVVIGRTPEFAWSVTSGFDDQIDTVAIHLDPGNRHAFTWDGQLHNMTCQQVVHRVAPPASAVSYDPNHPTPLVEVVKQEVCRAFGWPVVAWDPQDHVAWFQRTTTRYKVLEGAWDWLQLGKASNLDQFEGYLRTFPFTFNFNYAGPEGIAYLHTGDVPLRNESMDVRLPALPGASHNWTGEKVGAGLGLWAVNPSTGYTANWNNAPAKGWTAGDDPMQWGSIHRVQLIDGYVRQRIAATNGNLTWSDLAWVNHQAGTHDPFARYIAPFMASAGNGSTNTTEAAMAGALDSWAAHDYRWKSSDGVAYDDPGFAIYDAARSALENVVFRDELGNRTPQMVWDPPNSSDPHAADHGTANNKDAILLDALTGNTTHDWCDDVTSPNVVETCHQDLQRALVLAMNALHQEYGTWNVSRWRQPLFHDRFVAIGAFTPASMPMVNRGSWNQIVDLNATSVAGSRGVLPPGNDANFPPVAFLKAQAGMGQPAHLTNQLGAYENWTYFPLPWTRAQVEQLAASNQTLSLG